MARIAIIGTGISGLASAFFLHARNDIAVYEKNDRRGGHSRTLTVQHGDRAIPVDTGFIVFNERNYPNLTALFRLLGVRIKNSDMSFGLTVDNGRLEWGARNLDSIFGQRRNIVRPRFIKLVMDVIRFNRDVAAEAERAPDLTLGGLLSHMGMDDWFLRHYLLPMAGAIWSCPPRQMLDFPARVFIRFFVNHHLLSFSGQPQWLTLEGGAQTYVERLSAPFADRVKTGCGAVRVRRDGNGVVVEDSLGGSERFDQVVFGCHADEALALLADADEAERAALSAISYQKNFAVLHRDESIMPRNRRCWASWVYHADGAGDETAISVSYWMNSLQGIDPAYPLFVTLNPNRPIAEDKIFDTHVFHHPVFDFAALAGQAALKAMQGRRRIWFCGAHLGHGFHEDGLVSAMAVAQALGAPAPWTEAREKTGRDGARPLREAGGVAVAAE
jgi:predicted NAD/FAD-binding protein